LCNFDDYTQNGNSFISTYKEWIKKYSNKFVNSRDPKYHNSIIYENNDIDKKKAIIDFIAGMTDQFAIDAYNYIIKF